VEPQEPWQGKQGQRTDLTSGQNAQKLTTAETRGKQPGGKKRIDGSLLEPSNAPPTLAELGIDKKTSMVELPNGTPPTLKELGIGTMVLSCTPCCSAKCSAVVNFCSF
jgi:hypothetical protein